MLKYLADKIADKNKKPGIKQKPAVFIEFIQGHWAVQIKNPGQDKWRYVIDYNKKVNVYSHFGDILGTRPVIQSFDSYDAAVTWVTLNIEGAAFAKAGAADSNKTFREAIHEQPQAVFSS